MPEITIIPEVTIILEAENKRNQRRQRILQHHLIRRIDVDKFISVGVSFLAPT